MSWNSIQGKLIGLVVAGCLPVLALAGIWGGLEQESVIKRMEYVLNHKSEVNESVDHLNVIFKVQVQEWKNVP